MTNEIFLPLEDPSVFESLKYDLRAYLSYQFPGEFLFEWGQTEALSKYFYVKPRNKVGFLFEAQESGCILSACEKIIHEDMFVRKGELLDQVTLSQTQSQGDEKKFTRISSNLLDEIPIPYAMYTRKLIKWLGEIL